MRITFLVNDVATEDERTTTMLLAWAAARAGHTVFMIGLDQLTWFVDGHVGGVAHVGTPTARSVAAFSRAMHREDAPTEQITSADMDVLWIRYNPSEELEHGRHWGKDAGVLFGRLAMQRGVLVLDHPDTLAYALDKLYLHEFPESVRPATLVTRDIEEVRRFYEEHNRHIVLKPLTGYGGADVFLVNDDASNLNQLIDVISRSGYVMAQEYLNDVQAGDTRFILINGEPLVVDGHYAAFRRVAQGDDFRANITAGAKPRKARVTKAMLELAAIVGPKLKRDGIFFAGLDIIGDRLVELNTVSAGGLNVAAIFEKVDFAMPVIRAIERKVEIRSQHPEVTNIELATM